MFPDEITDDLTAFQFDAACLYVLNEWKNRRDFARFKIYKHHFRRAMRSILSELMTGKIDTEIDPPFEDDESDDDDDDGM